MPLVEKLLALGPKANVRYYGSGPEETTDQAEMVDLIYEITYAQPGGQTTLFARLTLAHVKLEHGHVDWQLAHAAIIEPEER